MSRARTCRLVAALVTVAAQGASAQCVGGSSPNLDFLPGQRMLFVTDFSQDPVGDFPAGMEFKGGALEVSRWNGQPALKASAPSALLIPLAETLPERFTVEVGVVNRNTRQVAAHTVNIYGGRVQLPDGAGQTRVHVGTVFWQIRGGGANAEAYMPEGTSDACVGEFMLVRVMVDGPKVKVYADDKRIASIPNGDFLRTRGLMLGLEGRDDGDNAVYVTSIRVTGDGPSGEQLAASPAPVASAPDHAARTQAQPKAVADARRAGAASLPPASLAAPTGLVTEYVGAGRHAFAWHPVPDAEYYELRVQHAECPSCRISIDPITDTTYIPQSRLDYAGSSPVVVVNAFAGGGSVESPASPPVTVPVRRWWGMYRVTVAGFTVNRATLDDPAQLDGKWDEVLVSVESQAYDGNGNEVGDAGRVWSKVHGDINAEPWRTALHPQHRIKAGSASTLGGLKAGDEFPGPQPWAAAGTPSTTSFPLFVWEGSLTEGQQTVEIAPVIWEADRIPSYVNQPLPNPARELLKLAGRLQATRIKVSSDVTGASLSLTLPPAGPGGALAGPPWAVREAAKSGLIPPIPLLRGRPLDSAQLRARIQSAGSNLNDVLSRFGLRPEGIDFNALQQFATSSLGAYAATMMSGLSALINNRDRPIGMVSGSTTGFAPTVLTLNFEYAEDALSGNGPDGRGPGVIEVRYADAMALGGMGDYSLYLRIERLK